MAVTFDINSEASCRRAYLNYHCYGNSMGISAADMGEITSKWSGQLTSWQASVSNDQTEYEFDDTQFQTAKDEGVEKGKDATGGFDNSGGTATAVGGAVTAAGGAVLGTLALTTLTMAKTAKDTKVSPLMWAAAGLEAALAVAYKLMNPNKEGNEACITMQEELNVAQGELQGSQNIMAETGEEIVELSDEAYTANEDTNATLEENAALYQEYLEQLQALQAKIDAGEELTEGEKQQYAALGKTLAELGVSIEEIQGETTDSVEDIYSEMEDKQEVYDDSAETIANVQGQVDYTASFDEATKNQAMTLGVSMAANAAVSGLMAGLLVAKAGVEWLLAPVHAAWAAVCVAAGISHGIAAKEQFDFANQAGSTIDTREGTQDLTDVTTEIYDQELDNYAGWMEGVEDLEMEVPELEEVPTGTAPVTGGPEGEGTASTGESTATAGTTTNDADDTNKKKEEE